jgi:hypothetical protein
MEMKLLHQIVVSVGVLTFCLQACTTLTATAATALPVPEATKIPLSQQVMLTSVSFKEEGQSPVYTISVQTPKLAGSDDERAQTFNQAVSDLIQSEIEYFRKNLLAQTPAVPVSAGSFFDAQYVVILQNSELWSLKFNFMGYADGAAHPYHYSMVFNYDLEQGRKLSLEELFIKDSNFLEVISSHCIFELSKRDIGFYGGFEQGAQPEPKNYRNWNITTNGLMITFDEYQVAPYAAGPQTVTIPYTELKTIINPKGPLAMFPH